MIQINAAARLPPTMAKVHFATIVMSVAALVVLFFDSTPKLVHFSSRSRRTKGPTAV
jgi:hypothetical protein